MESAQSPVVADAAVKNDIESPEPSDCEMSDQRLEGQQETQSAPSEVDTIQTTQPVKSALSASIEKRGKNSYYYCWNKDKTNNDPNAQPRLVAKTVDEEATNARTFTTISKYAWLDDDKHVKLYVELEGVGALDKEAVQISFTKRCVDLQVLGYKGQDHRLLIDGLHEDIDEEKSRMLLKQDKVIVTLIKAASGSWWKLKKSD